MAQSPAVPAYIFRGHTSPVHALHFFASNAYLASGESDGWIVVWALATRRPVAVWKAHEGGIMGLKDWGRERLISHGRDHKLRVWQVRKEDFDGLNKKLPVDGAVPNECQHPWLIHSMDINALNFCSFATCPDLDSTNESTISEATPLFLAAPNGMDSGGIDIFQLPAETRISKLAADKNIQTGMVMAIKMVFCTSTGRLTIIAGYEDGHVMVFARKPRSDTPVWRWERLAVSKPHSQPVLALDIELRTNSFISSSADANIARYRIPETAVGAIDAEKTNNTKHAGQQDIKIRSDGRILATAGWDQRVRVYSVKTLKELAVLRWHQQGCYSVAFAQVRTAEQDIGSDDTCTTVDTLDKLSQDRRIKAQNTHWLAAGAKDGKISLWDIY